MRAELKPHVLKFGRPGAKGTQNGAAKNVSVRDTMKSHFFVTGQIGMKFGGKRHRCALLNLDRRSSKLFRERVIFPENAIVGQK